MGWWAPLRPLKGAGFAQAPQSGEGRGTGCVYGCLLRRPEVGSASTWHPRLSRLAGTLPGPWVQGSPRRVHSPGRQGKGRRRSGRGESPGRGSPGPPDPRGGRCCLADPSLARCQRPSLPLPPRPPFVRGAARPRAEAAGRGAGGAARGTDRAGRSRGPGRSRTRSPRERSARRQPGPEHAPGARRGRRGGHRAEPQPEPGCLEASGPLSPSSERRRTRSARAGA